MGWGKKLIMKVIFIFYEEYNGILDIFFTRVDSENVDFLFFEFDPNFLYFFLIFFYFLIVKLVNE